MIYNFGEPESSILIAEIDQMKAELDEIIKGHIKHDTFNTYLGIITFLEKQEDKTMGGLISVAKMAIFESLIRLRNEVTEDSQ